MYVIFSVLYVICNNNQACDWLRTKSRKIYWDSTLWTMLKIQLWHHKNTLFTILLFFLFFFDQIKSAFGEQKRLLSQKALKKSIIPKIW